MTTLASFHVLLVGLWAGMYLFTTFVVSPAFKELFPDAAQRQAHRRVVGKMYARVNSPLAALLFLAALLLGFGRGWTLALGAELLLLVLIGVLIAWHVAQGQRAAAVPPAWLTHATLAATLLLCLAAVAAT